MSVTQWVTMLGCRTEKPEVAKTSRARKAAKVLDFRRIAAIGDSAHDARNGLNRFKMVRNGSQYVAKRGDRHTIHMTR